MEIEISENKNISGIWSQALTALRAFAVFAVLLGLIYPLFITAAAQLTMKDKADGSIVYVDGQPRGSTLIAQDFKGDRYFHPRPSAVDYDASNSGASNLAQTNPEFVAITQKNIEEYKKFNKIDTNVNIPSDAVTASGSGLDPHISIENARLQSKRVAKNRNLSENELDKIISQTLDPDFIGIWGVESVNVLKLNMALDRLTGK